MDQNTLNHQEKFLHGELTYYLRGVGFRVHNALKGGHPERVYEEAVTWVLEKEQVPYLRQPLCTIDYKGKQVGKYYPDLMLAERKVIVDFKVAQQIEALHKAQVLSYLAVTDAELGFIMNFGANSLQTERLPNFLADRKPFAWQILIPEDILFPALTNSLVKMLHIVQHELGPGFLHQVYRRATRIELGLQGISFDYLKQLPLRFEGQQISTAETRLLFIEEKLCLATIAVNDITSQHTEKMRWAMQEIGCQLGIIANFYPSRLDIRFLRKG